ncbi:MAG: hypothetical protein HUU43_01615 [Ignavibacteriaceae bacterium]|nr:hypothetical protein [Ignavibacteriaceae bacterium]NUM69519.1 hypothetical protein [Ignavibacteriaceae bacterium]
MEKMKVKWYQRKELYGLAAVAGAVLQIFSDEGTVYFRAGSFILIILGSLLPAGLRDGYVNASLPGRLYLLIDNLVKRSAFIRKKRGRRGESMTGKGN